MSDPQLETVAPASVFEQVAAMAKPPVVRLDRSRDNIASVHGERVAGDPLANVFFYQNGLPYTAAGVLLYNHPDVQNDPILRARAEKLLKRALKLRTEAPGDPGEDDKEELDVEPDAEDEDDYEPPKINLTAWAAGEQEIKWQEVSNFLARKYSKRVNDKRAALELLVEEKVIPIAGLSKANRKLLNE